MKDIKTKVRENINREFEKKGMMKMSNDSDIFNAIADGVQKTVNDAFNEIIEYYRSYR